MANRIARIRPSYSIEKPKEIIMNTTAKSLSALLFALALTGCGTTSADRGLSGAGLGAAAGAAGAAIAGSGIATGAVIGAAVGAAASVITDEDDVDLGKPAWKK
ncbi:MAG: osmotically inducible lipoprotein OsmB [Gammaproteobacteria bacterium]